MEEKITETDAIKLFKCLAVKSYKDWYYTMYSICRDVFMTNIVDIISEESAEAGEKNERGEAYRRKVIEAFMEYGKLKSNNVL